MNYELRAGDPTAVARVINMAHRFQCRAVRVDSRTTGERTVAQFEFEGDEQQLARLRAQIDRIVEFERVFVA